MPRTKQVKSKKSHIPYARGFRTPTAKQRLRASLRQNESLVELPKAFQESLGNHAVFEPIPKCSSEDDWLAQYKEDGQSYNQFLSECPWLSKRKRKYMKMDIHPEGRTLTEKYSGGTVYILPLGDFTTSSDNHLCIPRISDIIEYCQCFLELPVKILPTVSLRAEGGKMQWIEEKMDAENGCKNVISNMKSRYHKHSGRYQLRINDVLLKLRSTLPDDAICLIALTMYDLYEDNTDLFVAGMAAGNHRVAVFSLLRYDPNLTFSTEFWYSIDEHKTVEEEERRRMVLQRSCKLVVHEICHLLGIDHCIYYSCCMNGAGHLTEDFRQPMFLCPVDLRKLQTLVGFDIVDRYIKLRDFFHKHQMIADRDWVHRRLCVLTS